MTRDSNGMPCKKGQVWASPYRWGCTLIAYRKSALLRYDMLHPMDLETPPLLSGYWDVSPPGCFTPGMSTAGRDCMHLRCLGAEMYGGVTLTYQIRTGSSSQFLMW